MTYFEAYLFTRLDALNVFFVLLGTILFMGSLVMLVAINKYDSNDSKEKYSRLIKKVWKITLPICFISFLLAALTPSTKEAAFIYIAPKIINNTGLQNTIKDMPKLTNLGLEYLNGILEQKVEELKN